MKLEKDRYFRIYSYIIIVALFLCGIIFICTRIFEIEQKKSLIGFYQIDTTLTDNSLYTIDKIKNCRLTIYSDGTFRFNYDYPFIYYFKGKWKPRKAGIEEWNYFYFDKPKNKDSSSNIDCQVGDSWAINTLDSFIVFNSLTPKKKCKPIHVLYMKKINRTFQNNAGDMNINFSNENW